MRNRVDEADLAAITAAVGATPRVLYEDVHVYPLSAPAFVPAPGAPRAQPGPGPLKLYVHVPFCNYACTFCFYAKRVGVPRAQMERYVAAVERELEWITPGTPLAQLYVGGGTPTALPADLLDRLLAAICARTSRPDGISLTVECSPESVTADHLHALAARGVNRVSMGIESLDEGVLDGIRRRHGRAQALDACSLLVDSGRFVNVDLIYGLPGQSEDSFRGDLAAAAGRGPHSFTLYNLRLNEFTPARSALDDVERMDLPRLVRWRSFVKQAASELGYAQTRWHTFVRRDVVASPYDRAPCVDGFGAGRQLGVGASAASHLGHVVYRNEESLEGYTARVERGESPVGGIFALGDADRRTLFVARSLGDGGSLDPVAYAAAFGSTLEDDFGAVLARLRGAGLLAERAAGLALSPTGELVYDLALLAFYPERARRWLDERQSATRPAARKPLASAVTAA